MIVTGVLPVLVIAGIFTVTCKSHSFFGASGKIEKSGVALTADTTSADMLPNDTATTSAGMHPV